MPHVSRDPEVDRIIRALGMERHHTAGWYAPHYADSEVWGRAKLSSIYHLLTEEEPLPLHKIDGVEIWYFQMGAPAEITVSSGRSNHETTQLGTDLDAGHRPQLAVPAYRWQSCRTLGAWTLLSCAMSPGYSPRASIVMDTSH